MRVLVALVAVTGCVPTSSDTHRLSEDVTFVGVLPPFESAEACVRGAEDPRTCSLALTFCEDGRAARRNNLYIEAGTYYANPEKTLVHAFIGASDLHFDIAAVVELGSTMVWQVDEFLVETFLFETIDCNSSGSGKP